MQRSPLVGMMDYDALRAEQGALRAKNIHRGIGIASFIEVTNPSAAFYGFVVRKYPAGWRRRAARRPSCDLPDEYYRAGQDRVAHRTDRRQRAWRLDGSRPRDLWATPTIPRMGRHLASVAPALVAAAQATKVLRKNILDARPRSCNDAE
jgi:carbon-monoxide dehydrogenase large subunit